MKNACTFLYFRSKIQKLPDGEKFWIMNRMIFEIQNDNNKDRLNYLLELHLKRPISELRNSEWWLKLRTLSSAPLFYKILRIIK